MIAMAHTPSGLPAISPTRGEKTWGAHCAPIPALRMRKHFRWSYGLAADLSPPLWGRWPAGQMGYASAASALNAISQEAR